MSTVYSHHAYRSILLDQAIAESRRLILMFLYKTFAAYISDLVRYSSNSLDPEKFLKGKFSETREIATIV
jgi:hypothetical protein